MPPTRGEPSSARFWDDAARDNAAWYVANAYNEENDEFFAQGSRETDELLRFCGVTINPADVVLEIGSGVGRMSRRLAALSARLIATDVSAEMLSHARVNLAECHNVDYIVVAGDGTLPVETASVDVVFSYIVLQHVPTVAAQLQYLREGIRVLRPGGRLAVQIRASGARTVAHEWIGYVTHLARGRKTMSRAWRGARVPIDRVLALATDDVVVKVSQSSRRHLWVIANKAADEAVA